MTARWYDPSSGGFSSRDSAALPTTPSPMGNRYSYGASSPMNYSDPSGHNPQECQDLPGNPESAICVFPDSGGQIGSGLGGLPGGSSCGGSPLPPDVLAVDCCAGMQALASCNWSGADVDFNGGGASGSLTGSINGPSGGGTGGAGAPRPDPAIAARQANRAAALNNPLPIPGAMLTPLYGGSFTAPVSPASDLPSRTASDYQDPIDDINDSYQQLENSLTDDGPLLQNVDYSPSEIEQPHYCDACNWPTSQGRYPGMIGSDGRPMIDLEELDRRGIELSPRQWDLFENGGDDYQLSQLDPIPGHVYQPPPDLGDAGHLLFDLLGLVPGAGEWADGLNCSWYAAEGDAHNAALSCAATVPFVGWGATAAKGLPGPGTPGRRPGPGTPHADDIRNGGKVPPSVNKDFQFPGGGQRGEKVKFFVGPPNSVVRGAAEGRVFVTDHQGRVILDITRGRSKVVLPGIGFQKRSKETPTEEQLRWINELWGG